MTSTYPYSFESMSRIGNDSATVDQRNIQNMNNANYRLENFYPSCPMDSAMDFALKQPQVFYNGAHEGGVKGCKIEESSDLKYTHISRPACKLTLTQRPFLTVPFLGRGLGDTDAEFQLRAGENALNKKTVNNTMELNFSNHKNYPLIESMENYVSNPSYVIEEEAHPGWQRGGMSAREYARNQDKNK